MDSTGKHEFAELFARFHTMPPKMLCDIYRRNLKRQGDLSTNRRFWFFLGMHAKAAMVA